MTFLAYVPARKNSTRLKDKNIKIFNKKPLIMHSILLAKKSTFINNIYVSTDSKKVKNLSEKEGVKVKKLRAKALSSNSTSMHKLIKTECKTTLNKSFKFKYLILLQPTSPLRKVKDINNACKLFLKNKNKTDVLISTTTFKKNDNKKKLMYSDGKYLKYKKSKTFYKKRLRNGPAILIIKKNRINKFLIGGNILDYKMPYKRSVDIDYLSDFKLAQKYII